VRGTAGFNDKVMVDVMMMVEVVERRYLPRSRTLSDLLSTVSSINRDKITT
jgi:cell division protein FtsI/penicillin-binding protein 2